MGFFPFLSCRVLCTTRFLWKSRRNAEVPVPLFTTAISETSRSR